MEPKPNDSTDFVADAEDENEAEDLEATEEEGEEVKGGGKVQMQDFHFTN